MTALELEKVITNILNNSALPVETAYYVMLGITRELKTMMYEIEIDKLHTPDTKEVTITKNITPEEIQQMGLATEAMQKPKGE